MINSLQSAAGGGQSAGRVAWWCQCFEKMNRVGVRMKLVAGLGAVLGAGLGAKLGAKLGATLRVAGSVVVAAGGIGFGVAGCGAGLDRDLVDASRVGRYGGARVALQANLEGDPGNRNYVLGRLRLLILTLADGQPGAADVVAGETFRVLSTQGLNADRTISSAVINERVKIWKGEPFEQAFGYTYISIQKAMLGEWDNARAAANNSLFRLKDFTANERRSPSTQELARRAAAAQARGGGDYLATGYDAVESDFVLGHLLAAVSARGLGREDEAGEYLTSAAAASPAIRPTAERLASNTYNTVFVVDVGIGPEKVAYGSDGALARFVPRQSLPSSGVKAEVGGPGGGGGDNVIQVGGGLATDVNQMAASHMWNNLEDVRSAKSLVGTGLVAGGAGVAIASDDEGAQMAGLIAIGVGLLLKASASADTRYCEFLPQSTYIVPVMVNEPGSWVRLTAGQSTMTLTDLTPPPSRGERKPLQLRYVRMVNTNPAWAVNGETVVANDRTNRRVPGDTLPFIMGGTCVKQPNEATMQRYQQGGNLRDITASDLANLYREEGIALTVEDQRGESRKHVLDGGDSLVCPLEGTAGYQRLFGQRHAPYQPRSAALRDYLARHSRVGEGAGIVTSSEPLAPRR